MVLVNNNNMLLVSVSILTVFLAGRKTERQRCKGGKKERTKLAKQGRKKNKKVGGGGVNQLKPKNKKKVNQKGN